MNSPTPESQKENKGRVGYQLIVIKSRFLIFKPLRGLYHSKRQTKYKK